MAQSLVPIPCIHCFVHLLYCDFLPSLHILSQASHALTIVLIHCLLEHPEEQWGVSVLNDGSIRHIQATNLTFILECRLAEIGRLQFLVWVFLFDPGFAIFAFLCCTVPFLFLKGQEFSNSEDLTGVGSNTGVLTICSFFGLTWVTSGGPSF